MDYQIIETSNHGESHRERTRAAGDDVGTVSVRRSAGDDGYSPGTWSYGMSRGGWTTSECSTFDGGFASKALALEAAREKARAWFAD